MSIDLRELITQQNKDSSLISSHEMPLIKHSTVAAGTSIKPQRKPNSSQTISNKSGDDTKNTTSLWKHVISMFVDSRHTHTRWFKALDSANNESREKTKHGTKDVDEQRHDKMLTRRTDRQTDSWTHTYIQAHSTPMWSLVCKTL